MTAFSVSPAEADSLPALDDGAPASVSLPDTAVQSNAGEKRVAVAHDIYIQKMETSGEAVPGGTYIYQIMYGNQGGAQANNVVITDTLPMSITYAYDTFGTTPIVGPGNVLTWTVGTLLTNTHASFYLVVNIDPGFPAPGSLNMNCAGISSTTPGDGDLLNNQTCTGNVPVNFNNIDLQVNKNPVFNDPTPGQTLLYNINYGNNGGAASGPAVLTDTLPLSTTIVGWDAPDWPGLWTAVMTTTNSIVFYAPAGVPGYVNGSISLRLQVDPGVPLGTTLVNQVDIDAPGDSDPGNNQFVDTGAVTGIPREDLSINKSVHTAVPVAGGWVNYFINFTNNGNTAVPVIITDTMPPELSYAGALWGGNQPQQNDPFPPPVPIGNQLVWNLGVLEPGTAAWFHINMDITSTASITLPLVNCVDIADINTDTTPADNSDCIPLTLTPPGPNLRVTKTHQWLSNSQLRYEIGIKNLGTITQTNVWVTDTL
ncbi:MAG: hypothetical protein ACE5FD_13570, partial [Anaerolineae bacterium]